MNDWWIVYWVFAGVWALVWFVGLIVMGSEFRSYQDLRVAREYAKWVKRSALFFVLAPLWLPVSLVAGGVALVRLLRDVWGYDK